MTKLKLQLSLLALFSMANLAHAQGKQSVENAQKFLSLTLKGQYAHVYVYQSNGKSYPSLKNYGEITVFQAEERCRQKVKVSLPAYRAYSDSWPAEQYEQIWDFGKLVEVKQDEGDVNLYFTGMEAPRIIRIASEELATRVAFAFAYLKINCDATASTGF